MGDRQRLDFGGHDPDPDLFDHLLHDPELLQQILAEHNAQARRLRRRRQLILDLKAAALALPLGLAAMGVLALLVYGCLWLVGAI